MKAKKFQKKNTSTIITFAIINFRTTIIFSAFILISKLCHILWRFPVRGLCFFRSLPQATFHP